jgi:hypothetical protein
MARGQPDDPILMDGSTDWASGVNSVCTPTVASASNPNGLGRDQLAWLINATVRDGGITQRPGWKLKGTIGYIPQTNLLYQGSMVYEPTDQSNPYIVAVISGHVYQIDPDFSYTPIDLSAQFGLFLPSGNPQAYFVQAENYLVIQAGDGVTLPLFWNGQVLVQSNGLTGVTVVGQPVARTFQITTTAQWTEGAVGLTSSPVFLAAPYQGNLGDNILLVTALGVAVGQFRVTSIAPTSIILTTISLPGAPSNIAAGLFSVTLQVPGNPPVTTNNVTIGVGGFVMPAVGAQVTLNLLGQYFGNVGDTITISSTNLATSYGTFRVISFNAGGQLRVQCLTLGSVAAGKLIVQADFNITITAVRAFTDTWQTTGWTVPVVGASVNIIAQRFTPPYSGKVGDHILVTHPITGEQLGVFLFTATIPPGPETGAGSTFVCIATTVAGQNFPNGITISCQVVPPPAPSQNVVIGVGNWSVPPVGSSVSLQLLWDYTGTGTPTSYPGNVGDNVTLVSNAFPFTIGTFLVTQFDSFGGITLQTVSSNIVGTTFTTPIEGTLTINSPPSTTGLLINQLPAAYEMVYYMDRIFYNTGKNFSAGDIVGGPSGTSANNFLDSVLSVTENPLVLGGDGFSLPTQSGPITGFAVPNTVDASLGQGILLVGTRKAVYAMYVPVTRQDWIAANSNNQPQIVQVQFRDGFVGQGSIVSVNGDVYYLTWEPGIRSLLQATRLFSEPGNVPLSAEENRILQFNDTRLENFSTGINFDNRLLMLALPMQTAQGVVHQVLLPHNFTPISTVKNKKPPVWEGSWQGLQMFAVLEQDFDGVDRAFAITLSQNPNSPGAIELWEISTADMFESLGQPTEARVEWQLETPAFEFGDITALKKLVSLEMWVDKIYGAVEFLVEWRPDSDSCYKTWMRWSECVARDSLEGPTPANPTPYPAVYFPGYKATMTLPKPPEVCASATGRPAHVGYQFQFRITVKGFCRVRGVWPLAEAVNRKLYANMVNACKEWISRLWSWL